LDPAAEFEAWRLRELGRIKKEKEEEIRREEEREEIERRRAMPEEQRMKEDLQKAQKSRDEKPKGQAKFLQKYWHKGAFHQVRLVDIPICPCRKSLFFNRMRKSSNDMISLRPQNRLWTSLCFHR
jgi:hypothetical protein